MKDRKEVIEAWRNMDIEVKNYCFENDHTTSVAQTTGRLSNKSAEALYDRIARGFPEEAIRRALVKIKGPPTGDGNHWYTVGYDDAFNDLKNLWVGVDYSKIKFEPLIPKPCLHDRGLLRVEGTKPHCVTHGCETEVDERKGQRRVETRRDYDNQRIIYAEKARADGPNNYWFARYIMEKVKYDICTSLPLTVDRRSNEERRTYE